MIVDDNRKRVRTDVKNGQSLFDYLVVFMIICLVIKIAHFSSYIPRLDLIYG